MFEVSRRQSQGLDSQGIAARAVRENTPIDQLELRKTDVATDIKEALSHYFNLLLGQNVANQGTNKENSITNTEQAEICLDFSQKLYSNAVNTLTALNLVDKESIPSKRQIDAALKRYTAEQIQEIQTFEKATMVIIPEGVTEEQVVQEIHRQKLGRLHNGVFQSDFVELIIQEASKEPNTQWKLAIVEGCAALDCIEGDNIKKSIGERIQWFLDTYKKKGVTSMGILEYVLLQANEVINNNGKIIDDLHEKGSSTLLDIKKLKKNCVSVGFIDIYNGILCLKDLNLIDNFDFIWFRRSVMVDVF